VPENGLLSQEMEDGDNNTNNQARKENLQGHPKYLKKF
jgi:hypothetical protein